MSSSYASGEFRVHLRSPTQYPSPAAHYRRSNSFDLLSLPTHTSPHYHSHPPFDTHHWLPHYQIGATVSSLEHQSASHSHYHAGAASSIAHTHSMSGALSPWSPLLEGAVASIDDSSSSFSSASPTSDTLSFPSFPAVQTTLVRPEELSSCRQRVLPLPLVYQAAPSGGFEC